MKYYLYTDGCYKKEIEIAGIGGFLVDENNNEIFQFSEVIKDEKLFAKHEILALEHGLLKCIKLGIKDLQCFSDEEQLCNICNISDNELLKGYVEKNPSISRVLNLLPSFNSINFKYIPREENKKADSLSNKNIKTLMTNKKFKPKNINCAEHFEGNGKKIFTTIKSQIEYYLVFEIEKEKNQYIIKTTRSIKNKKTKDINISFIEEKILPSENWLVKTIKHITETVSHTKIESNTNANTIGIMFYGGSSQQIDRILRGKVSTTKAIQSELDNLDNIAMGFKRFIIHESRDIIDLIKEQDLSEKDQIENHKDFIVNALKVLGEDYKIGQNKLIENYFDLPDSKKENVIEIQKKYFGELVKISLLEMRKDNNSMVCKQSTKERVDFLRKGLENNGVKLKY